MATADNAQRDIKGLKKRYSIICLSHRKTGLCSGAGEG